MGKTPIISHVARASVSVILAGLLTGPATPASASPISAVSAGVSVDPTIYISPIDITRGRINFRAAAPQRDSGKLQDVAVPPDVLPPKMRKLTDTPLGIQLDEHWNVTKDSKTGLTPRQEACDGENGIKRRVQDEIKKIGSGFSAYEISCNLATTGLVVSKQVDSTLYVSYQLLNNTVDFRVTSPATCHRDHGTFLCPNDPRFSVRFASEVWTTVRVPSVCQLIAEAGKVNLHAVQVDSHNFSGDVAKNIVDTLFLGNKFTSAELAMQATERKTPLPLDDSFKELREGAPCKDRNHPAALAIAAFRDVETSLHPKDGITIRMIHPAMPAPRFQNVENPSSSGPTTPSFARPSLSTQPIVAAGAGMQVKGQLFPPNLDVATVARLGMEHDAACIGGATELEWGPAGGPLRRQRLPGAGINTCAPRHEVRGLTPATAYQYRARDCDAITCSPWTAPLRLRTGASNASQGAVALTLDSPGGTPLGTATVNPEGTFEVSVTIPANTSAGTHTIYGISGDAKADAKFDVTVSGSGGGKGKLVLTGTFFGDKGCPSRPLPNPVAEIGTPFSVFGSGFAAGALTLHVDSATGMALGTAQVKPDGTFCKEDFQGPPDSLLGDHALIAVQNGTVVTTSPVKFVRPTVVR